MNESETKTCGSYRHIRDEWVRWCGDEEEEETCVLLFGLESVMDDVCCLMIDCVLRHFV